MLTSEIVHALDRAAATYAAGQPDPIGAYHAYLAGALAALQQVRADLLAMPRPASRAPEKCIDTPGAVI